ncbi:MAG: MFS transporter [Anaerolineae bacterium]
MNDNLLGDMMSASTADASRTNAAVNVRTFYILIVTQVISAIGSRMTSLALSIYLYGTTGDVTPLAMTALFQFLPGMLGASVAGVLADRYDRRKVMALADAGQAVGTVLLMISFASGSFQLWHLYAVTFLQALFAMFQGPAFTASVSTMIPDGERNRANALMQLVQPAAGIIAPPIAGMLYASIGLVGVMTLDLSSFLFAVVVLMLVRIPRPILSSAGRDSKGSVLREAMGGVRYLWKVRPLFWVTVYAALLNFIFSVADVVTTPYVLARTGNDQSALGVIMAISSFGAIVGSIVLGAWGGFKSRIKMSLLGISLTGVFFVVTGLSRTPLALGISAFMFMFSMPMVNGSFMGLIQAKVPHDLQGRVFALLGQLAIFLIPLAYLLSGPLADTVVEPAVRTAAWAPLAPLFGAEAGAGMGLMIASSGLAALALTIVVFGFRSIRNLEQIIPDYKPETEVTTGAITDESVMDAPVSVEPVAV